MQGGQDGEHLLELRGLHIDDAMPGQLAMEGSRGALQPAAMEQVLGGKNFAGGAVHPPHVGKAGGSPDDLKTVGRRRHAGGLDDDGATLGETMDCLSVGGQGELQAQRRFLILRGRGNFVARWALWRSCVAKHVGLYTALDHGGKQVAGKAEQADGNRLPLADFILEHAQCLVESVDHEVAGAVAHGSLQGAGVCLNPEECGAGDGGGEGQLRAVASEAGAGDEAAGELRLKMPVGQRVEMEIPAIHMGLARLLEPWRGREFPG